MIYREVVLGGSLLFCALLSAQTAPPSSGLSHLVPENLRCEDRVDPLGLDLPQPRLGWILQSDKANARGQRQTAYRILVASSPDILTKNAGDLWDSGKIASDQMNQIPYGGKPIPSAAESWWKVEIWDQDGKESVWSVPAQWTTGLLKPEDWTPAQWIGAPDDTPVDMSKPKAQYETVLLRHDLTIKPGLKKALFYLCGLGQYELTLNGAKVGNQVLAPGWTDYKKTCLYDGYDITTELRLGGNTLGIFLGNGMYLQHFGPNRWASNIKPDERISPKNPVQAIGLLRLVYANGSTETVGTDATWQAKSGPVTYSSIYGGEDFDARLNPQNWDQPGFKASDWAAAQILSGPGGALRGLSRAGWPLRTFETLTPVSQKQLAPDTTVYDLGQNAALIPHLSVTGPAGSSVKIYFSELVNSHGDINDTMTRGTSSCTYTLAGNGTETWSPRFFYQGARYLKIVASPAPGSQELPRVQGVSGLVIHAAAPEVGQFTCSNDLFNKIYWLVRWAQQNNMVSLITDCPTREKRGWLEQDHLNGPALRYNFDLNPLMAKITQDMADDQEDSGLIPDFVPVYSRAGGAFFDSPEWGSAYLIVPWQQYLFSGDLSLLRNQYEGMKRYQAYLQRKAQNNIVAYGLSDWYDIGPKGPGQSQLTPRSLSGTAFYYYDTWILAQTAKLLGKNDEAAAFSQQADQIRDAYQDRHFHSDTNQYGAGTQIGSQYANAVSLFLNLPDEAVRPAVLNNIVQDVQAKGLTAGDVGYRFLLRALGDGDRSDVIYDLNNQSSKPGYGLQLKRGATSLTEAWDANSGSSQDHFMLGQINEWFFRNLLGIQENPDAPGFKKIIIRPSVVGDLTWVKGSYDSIQGKIVSEWQHSGSNFTLHLVIPINTSATVYLPMRPEPDLARVSENMNGITFQHMEGNTAVYTLTAGDYTLKSTLP